ncbi:DUF86 domain-containing protein [Heliorestis acidaminivorans]|uniref:DUF86 domain-containing protein n=1 Tax=Heliorestis acidaminivorans TaxID=553427 RepID=A0A6I0ESG4_9FIRM|nr:DUF86 domain-containing protein [Heliorestis acidaminivorans]KAB2951802.1 DUF86 domain-containing protein [Heliorestis acidaminivorans]
MVSDVILNKVQVIERCMNRINEVYDNNPDNLQDLTKQDSIVLNLQRLCEASIDLAMHIVSERKLGIPQSSRDAFDMLEKVGIIEASMAKNLKAMVGFRNIAVHDYQSLDLIVIQKIIEAQLDEIKAFSKKVVALAFDN